MIIASLYAKVCFWVTFKQNQVHGLDGKLRHSMRKEKKYDMIDENYASLILGLVVILNVQ